MGFAQEMKDMLGGFQTVSGVVMRMKTLQAQQEYRNSSLDMRGKAIDAKVDIAGKHNDTVVRGQDLTDAHNKVKEQLDAQGNVIKDAAQEDNKDYHKGILAQGAAKLDQGQQSIDLRAGLGSANIATRQAALRLQDHALQLRAKGLTEKQVQDELKKDISDIAIIKKDQTAPKPGKPPAGPNVAVPIPGDPSAAQATDPNYDVPVDLSGQEGDVAAEDSNQAIIDGQYDGTGDGTDDSAGASQFARGGMVKKLHAAGGSPVTNDDPILPAPGSAIPAVASRTGAGGLAPAPTPAPTPTPAPAPAQAAPAPAPTGSDVDPAANGVNVTNAHDNSGMDWGKITPIVKKAAKDGMSELIANANKIGAVPTDAKKDIPTADDMKEIDSHIDPDNTLAPYQKGAVRLATLYQAALDKGDVKGAKSVAKQVLDYNMMASKTQGLLAMHALRQGDTDSAASLVADSYNNIPDGQHLTYKMGQDGNVNYSIMNGDNVIKEGTANTAQLWGMSKNIASGAEFIKHMAAVAGDASSPISDEKTADPAAAPSAGADGKSAPAPQKMTFNAAAEQASSAAKTYGDLLAKYNDATQPLDDAAKRELYPQLTAAKTTSDKARQTAQYVADKIGVKPVDFNRAILYGKKSQDGALPTAPAKAEPAWNWLGLSKGSEPPVAAGAAPTGGGKALDPQTAQAAKTALAAGKNRAAVLKRLQDNGYSTEGL